MSLHGPFNLTLHQSYTNNEACSNAGTFIQHVNLNILRRYLHKPYLENPPLELITAPFEALNLLCSCFSLGL